MSTLTELGSTLTVIAMINKVKVSKSITTDQIKLLNNILLDKAPREGIPASNVDLSAIKGALLCIQCCTSSSLSNENKDGTTSVQVTTIVPAIARIICGDSFGDNTELTW
jgi:hypothetical protein